jgi:quinol monooxygenase YgiN
MSDPIVFVSHSRVKDGRLEGFREFLREGARALQADKPGTVVFLAYVDASGTEATIVHAFPDAAAMDAHLQGVDERSGAADAFIETTGYEIYGTPSPQVLEAMQRFAASEGVPLAIRPDHVGGYLCPGPD